MTCPVPSVFRQTHLYTPKSSFLTLVTVRALLWGKGLPRSSILLICTRPLLTSLFVSLYHVNVGGGTLFERHHKVALLLIVTATLSVVVSSMGGSESAICKYYIICITDNYKKKLTTPPPQVALYAEIRKFDKFFLLIRVNKTSTVDYSSQPQDNQKNYKS